MTESERVREWQRYLQSPAVQLTPWHAFDAAYRNDGERVFLALCKAEGVKGLVDFVKLLAPR